MLNRVPPAALAPLGGHTSTGGGALPVAAGDFVDQRAGDREADGFRCEVEGVCIHNGGDTNAAE